MRNNLIISGVAKNDLIKAISELIEGDKTAVTGVVVHLQTSIPTKRKKYVSAKIELAFDPSIFKGTGIEALSDCKIVPLLVFDDKYITPDSGESND